MWLRHISTEMAKRVNLFLFQGLCVDDAQGQRRLGIQLLDGSCNLDLHPGSSPLIFTLIFTLDLLLEN